MPAKVLMVQGTMSSAGKSLLVTALCRIFARRGQRVAPFKAQNMSNNAGVCADGSEIGRAQYTQALACGIEPAAVMNPVLIKPEADARSHVVVMGRPYATLSAKDYYKCVPELWQTVTKALDSLRSQYDLVIVEGAGSPAELNLGRGDIVNMAIAKYAQAPVLLIGDIDRGGIFAQLLGTLWLLDPDERALIRGLVANKFRGDPALFVDGVRILEERSGDVPVLGVIPYLHDLAIPEEDAVSLEVPPALEEVRPVASGVDIAVIRLPRIANFDDFDPLASEPGVRVRYVSARRELGQPQALILPGTKSTIADLEWMRNQGLAEAISQLAGEGTAVVGICGGFQMMGQVIRDPGRVESSLEEVLGLDLLPIETLFEQEKATNRVSALISGGPGWLSRLAGQAVRGYEIHMGHSRGAKHWLVITERNERPVKVADGAASADGRVWGCYLHGLFENVAFRRAWLSSLGWSGEDGRMVHSPRSGDAFDHLADAVERALDMGQLERILEDG